MAWKVETEKMKIFFRGNNDSGTVLLFSIILLTLFTLLAVPVLSGIVQKGSLEKKKYEKICDEIETNNSMIRALYEIN